MKTINILDCTQLIRDGGIIPILAEKEENEIYVPVSVFKELDSMLSRNILDEIITNKIIRAKRILKINESRIFRWKAKGNADSAILQLIEQKIGDPSVGVINVYTTDEALAKECLAYQQRNYDYPSIINILQYEEENENLTIANNSPTYPKHLNHLECAMWRNNVYLPDFKAKDSLAQEPAPIPTLSGNKTVTKYWAWYVRGGDVYRIYKQIKLHQGETVSLNIVSFDNHCDVYVRLMTYCEADKSEHFSEVVSLSEPTWKTLSYIVPQDCDYFNLEILPKRDSEFNGEWSGIDGFIDDIKITR